MRSLKRAVQQCVIETLEQRRLLSAQPPPFDAYVGPMPQSSPPGAPPAPGSPPTAELVAQLLSSAKIEHYLLNVTYRDDVAVRAASIDDADIRVRSPRGEWHDVELSSVDRLTDGPIIRARYLLLPPGGTWDVSDNGTYTVDLRSSQVFDIHGNAANGGTVGTFEVRIPNPGTPGTPGTPINKGVDVRQFGAYPDDGIDDTAAIQRAINSLPLSNGVPGGEAPAGGIILFPAGVFDINRSIKLPSGVTLRGAGSSSTVIHDTGTDRNHSAILYYSPYAHGHNIGATVDNLSIYSRWGGGIWLDPGVYDVLELRLANLRVSSLGPAIDLSAHAVYYGTIENVEIYNPGSTALRVGRYDGEGADVLLRGIRVTGVARAGFQAQRGLVWLSGDSLTQGLRIDTRGANVVPLYISSNGANYSGIGPTMFDVDIQVPAADCPGRVGAHLDNISRVDIDSLIGIGSDHKLKLTNANDVQIRYMGSDGTTNVVSWMVSRDARSNLRIGNNNGGLLQFTPQEPPRGHTRVPSPTIVIDATRFGVVPDDGRDDTAALQAAIDSLPRNSGIPGSDGQPVGGIVQLPLGLMNTSAPIKLPSGVWLRGHGNGTVIRNFASPRSRAVIELSSPYAHSSNVGAALDSLGIHSSFAAAIKADSTITGELRDLRIAGLRLRVGGSGIDLRNVTVNYANIERVTVYHPAGSAIWLGRPDNSSMGNIVRNLRTFGMANPLFQPDGAMFTFYGDTTIEGGSIEHGWNWNAVAPVTAFYGSGTLKINGLYTEFPRHSSGNMIVFDNAQATVDRFVHAGPDRRIQMINGSEVQLRSHNINGWNTLLRETISMDGSSRFTVNTVNGRYDSGLLDHPRVTVKGFYNNTAGTFIETDRINRGTNLVADPTISRVSEDVFRPEDWTIVWGNGTSGPMGTWTVETVGSERRLRIDLSRPAYFDVRVKLNVPASMVGKHALVRWRVDAPAGAQVLVDNNNENTQFPARALGSLTAAKTVTPLRPGEQIWFQVGSVTNLMPAGTYYFWKVGAVPA